MLFIQTLKNQEFLSGAKKLMKSLLNMKKMLHSLLEKPILEEAGCHPEKCHHELS